VFVCAGNCGRGVELTVSKVCGCDKCDVVCRGRRMTRRKGGRPVAKKAKAKKKKKK
jgi:hypothetical protein